MKKPPGTLLDGYKRFRSGRYKQDADKYAALGQGQSPKSMIIACADSRVDPTTIFDAGPGDLFIVRNVANIVPPCLPLETSLQGVSSQGVSSALQFAVESLKVEDIIVLGHSGCGGVAAALSSAKGQPIGDYIAQWVKLLSPAIDALQPEADEQTALEKAGVRMSLQNLESFPFITTAIKKRDLRLHGAWFCVPSGELVWL